MKLHIDIETYSSVDITTSGVYKYVESPDFEILLVAYSFGSDPIIIIDLAQGEKINQIFLDALCDPEVEKHAHNANFERNCFKAIGYDIPVEQWHCSAVKAGYCGYPLSSAIVLSVPPTFLYDLLRKIGTGRALCCLRMRTLA